MITIDSCYSEVHDDLTFNVIGATMAYYNLTFNVIGATIESPLQNPLACLYKPRACGNKVELLRWNPCQVWLSLPRGGAGFRTAGSPLLGTPRLCWGKFHCLSLSVERLPHLSFWMLSFKPAFSLPSFTLSRGSLVLCFLPWGWYYPHIWCNCYFSQQSWFQLVLHPGWHFACCTLSIS